eukprot:1068150-Pelagomonas_calceolata.AAC.1
MAEILYLINHWWVVGYRNLVVKTRVHAEANLAGVPNLQVSKSSATGLPGKTSLKTANWGIPMQGASAPPLPLGLCGGALPF